WNFFLFYLFFVFQAEDGIRDFHVTGVQTCALPISSRMWWSFPWWHGDVLRRMASVMAKATLNVLVGDIRLGGIHRHSTQLLETRVGGCVLDSRLPRPEVPCRHTVRNPPPRNKHRATVFVSNKRQRLEYPIDARLHGSHDSSDS